MSIFEMENAARQIKELQTLIDEAQAEMDALKDACKAAMGDREEIRAGAYTIRYKPVTSSRLDTSALKKALPELVQQFTRETTTRRFTVC